MDFSAPLHTARLIRRYKRFLADIAFPDGSETTAHCPNPGRMLGVAPSDATIWLSRAQSAKRKWPLTWELVEVDGGLVGINTNTPNKLVGESLADGRLRAVLGEGAVRAEFAHKKGSRVDFLLTGSDDRRHFIEVKNVHLRRKAGLAEFPDCVTARGTKHLKDLAEAVSQGARATMVYVVQRMDCQAFDIADDIDPDYGEAFDAARARGVDICVMDCDISPNALNLRHTLPLTRGAGAV
jgi:sugar fermentation stimulation protein A